MNTDDRYYRTTDFYLASYLCAKDFELANIDWRANIQKAVFVFPNSIEFLEYVDKYKFTKDCEVDVHKLFYVFKDLKRRIQDYKNEYKEIQNGKRD